MLNTHWKIFDGQSSSGMPIDAKVVAVETNHVLLEFEGIENRWGGLERAWVPTAVLKQGRYVKLRQVGGSECPVELK